MALTNREKEIMSLIKNKPMISQQEIADTINISRASVAVHITNMMKKGYILGKKYVLNDNNYTLIVGGANMDISGFPTGELRAHDSNPGEVKLSVGGVGRNIAENLVRLGSPTKLVTALGDDLYGKRIIEEGREIGLDMQDSFIMNDFSTSTYVSILDETRDMHVAISHMDIYEHLSIDMIRTKHQLFEGAKTIVLDTNIPEEVIAFIMTKYADKRIFVDPVSTQKSLKIKDYLNHITIFKPNILEAQFLSGIEAKTNADLKKIAKFFLDAGVKKLFISLGSDGVFYADHKKQSKFTPKKQEIVNANGAGDAFSAGLIYADALDYSLDDTAKFACAAACIALHHQNTINPDLSFEAVEAMLQKI